MTTPDLEALLEWLDSRKLARLDEAAAAIRELRGDLQMLRGQLAGKAQGNVAKGAFEIYANNERLKAELEAARKDAERYEWVRTHPVLTQKYIADEFAKLGPFDLIDPVAIDRVIDAALAAREGPA
jgi:hypothetical protein